MINLENPPIPLGHYLKRNGINWMAQAALPYEERQKCAEDLERDLRERLEVVSRAIDAGADGRRYTALRQEEKEILEILEPGL